MCVGVNVYAVRTAQEVMLSEEERVTQYSHDELDQDWEFKIVRAYIRTFHKPKVLRQLIKEESRAGWIMLEKFDDTRIRFKRPMAMRKGDSELFVKGVDPYRTHYGMSLERFVAWYFVILFGGGLFLIGFLVLINVLVMRLNGPLGF